MQLNFTDEQVMLRETIAAFLADRYDFDSRKKALEQAPHWRPDIWKALAEELGVLGASFPESLGGFGGGAVENLIIMEELGRALVVEPYLPSIVIGGGFLKHSGHPRAAELAAGVIDGSTILAFAQAERNSRFNPAAVETRASADGDGWVIDGHKRMVVAGPIAHKLFVTARTSGGSHDKDGISVFLVDVDTPGVELTNYVTYDGFLAADVSFANVKIGSDALFGAKDKGLALVEQVLDDAIAAIAAESSGVLRTALERTVEYSRERKQFGAPLSSFQALQHRMSDMFIEVEQVQSMAWLGAIRAEADDPAFRARGISAVKVQIGNACRKVGQSAIQVHGGMGMTDEMAISHYFKRATMIESMFGSVDYHLARIEAIDAAAA